MVQLFLAMERVSENNLPICNFSWRKVVEKKRPFMLRNDSNLLALCNVTILEGAEVRIGFYGRGGRILRGDTPEGAEGPEGWPRG